MYLQLLKCFFFDKFLTTEVPGKGVDTLLALAACMQSCMHNLVPDKPYSKWAITPYATNLKPSNFQFYLKFQRIYKTTLAFHQFE